jgi:hypothetical protein
MLLGMGALNHDNKRHAALDDQQELAGEILGYLEKHPEAKDTAEGIARWWLQRREGFPPVDAVERAITSLLSRGLIVETRRAGVPPYYRVNDRRRGRPPSAQGGRTENGGWQPSGGKPPDAPDGQ